MAKDMIDFKEDENDDLFIENGDFVFEESTKAHQRDLILSEKTEWKENPTVGVGAINYLDDDNPLSILQAIALEFTRDGMRVNSIKPGANGNIITDAHYE